MLGSVDATMRPLKLPPKFVLYLERNRIFELFQEIATNLIIEQPSDHVLHIKEDLKLAAERRDFLRIILLGEPYSEILHLAQLIAKKLSLHLITLKDIHAISPDVCEELMGYENVAKNLTIILKQLSTDYHGWIIVDLPRTKKEARAFQHSGIWPTQVLEIANSRQNRCERHKIAERENILRDLREILGKVWTKIVVGDKNLEDLVEKCATLAIRKNHSGAPCIFRVALIGSRGSGCRSLAKHLAQRFHLIHVDFPYILQQARLRDNLSALQSSKMMECPWDIKPRPDVAIQIVEKHLLRDDCLKAGWVLTGYPITVEDFELLDKSSTPPNRVIFLDVDVKNLRERLLNRRYNVETGSKYNVRNGDDYSHDKEFFVRPEDLKNVVEADIREYGINVKSMMMYAGKLATIIDGNAMERIVRERVEACLMRPAPFRELKK